MTLCLWVKHPFLCHFVKPLAFVLFLLRYMDFQNHLPMRTDASAGGVFTILLCFYYISAHCLGYCICTYASERYFHVRSDKSKLLQCKQQQSQLKNSSEEQCQEFHSLTNNQIPQLLHASQGNTPDFQTAYQKFHSSGLTYLNTGHQTMQACSYCIKWVAYFNSVSISLFAQLNTESVNQILFLMVFFIISEIANM